MALEGPVVGDAKAQQHSSASDCGGNGTRLQIGRLYQDFNSIILVRAVVKRKASIREEMLGGYRLPGRRKTLEREARTILDQQLETRLTRRIAEFKPELDRRHRPEVAHRPVWRAVAADTAPIERRRRRAGAIDVAEFGFAKPVEADAAAQVAIAGDRSRGLQQQAGHNRDCRHTSITPTPAFRPFGIPAGGGHGRFLRHHGSACRWPGPVPRPPLPAHRRAHRGGVCPKRGKRPPRPGRSRCEPCLEKDAPAGRARDKRLTPPASRAVTLPGSASADASAPANRPLHPASRLQLRQKTEKPTPDHAGRPIAERSRVKDCNTERIASPPRDNISMKSS